MTIPVRLPEFRAYTDKPLAPPGYVNRNTVNTLYSREFEEPNRGYTKFRQVVATTDTYGQRASLIDSDGNERHYYIVGNTFYPETGSDSPSSLGSVTNPVWHWAIVKFGAPSWVNVNLNGTVSDAQFVRGTPYPNPTSLEIDDFSFSAPGTVTVTPSTSGGSLPDGQYIVRQTWIDDDGATTVETAPSGSSNTATISGGGGSGSLSVPEPGSAPSRATKIRLYVSYHATTAVDAPNDFNLELTYNKAAGTQTVTTIGNSTTSPPNRSGAYQTAEMPIADARVACEHLGRLFFASVTDNTIYWSERDAPNQFYATNFRSDFNGQIRGLASNNGQLYVLTDQSIYVVTGDFSRDSGGANATFALMAQVHRIDHNIGCVSHATIVPIGGVLFFMSTQGPAMIRGNSVQLLRAEDFASAVFGRSGDSALDWDYADRWSAAEDVENGLYCILVTRKVNSSRAMDGASTAGMPDTMLRWDYKHGVRMPDLRMGDMTHISSSVNDTIGSLSRKMHLMAMGPHGYCLQLNTGWSGGGAATAATDTNNDGKLATAQTGTTATIEQAGLSADDLIGQTVTIFYPSTDTTYPGVVATKTIKDSTATSGGEVTITWNGSLPSPSSTLCTFRVAGYECRTEWMGDLRQYTDQLPPDEEYIISGVRAYMLPTAQIEAVS